MQCVWVWKMGCCRIHDDVEQYSWVCAAYVEGVQCGCIVKRGKSLGMIAAHCHKQSTHASMVGWRKILEDFKAALMLAKCGPPICNDYGHLVET